MNFRLVPFDPEKKIIEYILRDSSKKRLIDLTIEGFANETASESPAPGGGSVAACMGAFGAALGTMVANLSAHKPGWDDRWKEFSDWADKGKAYMDQLISLVDEDTNAFNKIMEALVYPRVTMTRKPLEKKQFRMQHFMQQRFHLR